MSGEKTIFTPSEYWSNTEEDHAWPRSTDEQDIDYVYHGRMENLPRSTSKIVRIFLSSTFTDTVVERNLLMKNVFPEMRQYCRDQHDLDFQVVDMRWGVRHEANVDHSASELCMREIKTCNEVSLGPTFVTLLSHKYGNRPLPVRVQKDEMDILLSELEAQSKDDLDLVRQWYQLDENAMPHEYILKPLVSSDNIELLLGPETTKGNTTRNLEKTDEPTYEELLEQGKQCFQKAAPKLKLILKRIAEHCLDKMIITKQQALKYTISVTEEEIVHGIRDNERRRDRCLAFIRHIDDINLKHEKAWRFTDMQNGQEDQESQNMLKILRDKTIPELLPDKNIFQFRTSWTDSGDRGVRASKFTNDATFSEILEHGHQCVGKVERFYGREDVLEYIKSYLCSGCTKPLVIWGESGSGKTSVLAKAAQMVPKWLGESKNILVPVRFLGTTPDSSTIYKTLASICRQLLKVCEFKSKFEIPEEFVDLKEVFRDMLTLIPEGKKVVLLLDSLDQLAETNSAHNLHWLPLDLPKNVKLVLSVLPREHNILPTLRATLSDYKELFIEVKNLSSDTSAAILDMWLTLKNRRLTAKQDGIIAPLIEKSVRPLYLKLIYDEIYAWKSYQAPLFACKTIESCLIRLYQKLETKHGKVLVTKALAYLSSSANGLTELEIEDILSLDEEVLNDVFQFHIPPIRRLPSILWARVRRDLDEYIVDREADGTKVMAWYHRQFIEQANLRYLGAKTGFSKTWSSQSNLPIYYVLRDYFAGTWADNNPKPFKYTEWQRKKLNATSNEGAEVRHVSEQPAIFKDAQGTIDIENPRYNLRKVSELPIVCSKIKQHEDNTEFVAKHVCLDPEFVVAWLKNKPWEEISEFMSSMSRESDHAETSLAYTKIIKKQYDGKELTEEDKNFLKEAQQGLLEKEAGMSLQISTVHQCLLLSYISVLQNPSFFAMDVAGRLLVYKGILPGIDNWIKYCNTKGRHLCAFVSPHLQLQTPGSELLFIINNHDGPVNEAFWSSTSSNICISFSRKLVVVSLELGQVIVDTRPRSVPLSDSFKFATEKSGEICAALEFHPWVYFFNEIGEVTHLIKLDEALKNQVTANGGFKVAGILYIEDESIGIFTDSPEIPFIIINKEKEAKSINFEDQSRIIDMYVIENDVFVITQNSQILKYSADSSAVTLLESYPHSIIATYALKGQNFERSSSAISIAFSDGSIVVKEFKEEKVQQLNYNVDNSKFGCVEVIYHSAHDDPTPFVVLLCTSTHLLFLSSCASDDMYSDSSEQSCDQTVKLQFRIRKHYDKAEITQSHKLLIAARVGQVDLYQVLFSENTGKVTGRFFTSIDSHGQPITRILSTDEDILYMTASQDHTIKFWMVAKAGIIRKYIPNFDKADSCIVNITPRRERAFTIGKMTKGHVSMEEWNIVTGKKSKRYQHSSRKGKIRGVCYDAKNERIVGIDMNGTILVWNVPDTDTHSLAGSLKRKTTSKLSRNEELEIAAEKPDYQLATRLKIESSSRVHLVSFKSGIVLLFEEEKLRQRCYFVNFDPVDTTLIQGLPPKVRDIFNVNEECIVFVPHQSNGIDLCIFTGDAENIHKIYVAISELTQTSVFGKYIALASSSEVYLCDPVKMISKAVNIPKLDNPRIFLSTSGLGIIYCVDKCCFYKAKVTGDSVTHDENIYALAKDTDTISDVTMTHDGKYVICVADRRMLRLIRYADGKLLALYTMFDLVESIAVSLNNWYVLLGTTGQRFFVLVIADPAERNHDKRIQYVREKNPGLSREQALALMGEANNDFANHDSDIDISDLDSSDDEALLRVAEKRLDMRRKANDQIMFCLQSDEESSNSSSGNESRPATRRLATRESTMMQSFEDNLQPTAHAGEIFGPSPCSLQ